MLARYVGFIVGVLFSVHLVGATVFVDLPAAANVFQPISVSVQPGDTVTWRNPAGGGSHEVSSDDGVTFDSGPPAAGPWTFSFTFNTSGTYPYHDPGFGAAGGFGMSGIVFVGRLQHGRDEHILQISPFDLTPEDSSVVLGISGNNGRTATGNLWGGVDLPTGSLITSVEISACDFDAVSDGGVFLYKCQEPGSNCVSIAAVLTGGGCSFTYYSPINELVDNLGHTYQLLAVLTNPAQINLRSIRIFYKLPVTYGPAVASFNDVPTTHPFFRFIEALFAAGITGGCSTNPPQYCPDAPLTRGQMAVFISQALGLSHPF